MYSLIGDRFLKRFFGYRSHRHKVNLASEEKCSPENEAKLPSAEGPVESCCPPSEDLPIKVAPLEIKNTGEIDQIHKTHE